MIYLLMYEMIGLTEGGGGSDAMQDFCPVEEGNKMVPDGELIMLRD